MTERRAMEKTLRRQEEFQRYLLESFPDLILVIDREERYSFVSSRIRDLLGYKPEDFMGKKIAELQDRTCADLSAFYREVIRAKRSSDFVSTRLDIGMARGEPCGPQRARCTMPKQNQRRHHVSS